MNQGDFKVPNFILNVLGRKGSDVTLKALSTALKEKVRGKKRILCLDKVVTFSYNFYLQAPVPIQMLTGHHSEARCVSRF